MERVVYTMNHGAVAWETVSLCYTPDALIEKRKRDRAKEGLCLWDDWLFSNGLLGGRSSPPGSSAASSSSGGSVPPPRSEKTSPEFHFVLEARVPPSELSLNLNEAAEIPPASRAVRSLPADSDESDADDPVADGRGSFLDFLHRRVWSQWDQHTRRCRKSGDALKPWGFHCVDPRDLGEICSDTPADGKEEWARLFESAVLSKEDIRSGRKPDFRSLWSFDHSPEIAELEKAGLLSAAPQPRPDERRRRSSAGGWGAADSSTAPPQPAAAPLPSFERFFGEPAELLYYSPHVKTLYSGFLGHCVKSLATWEAFFTQLFLGGRIEDALNLLDLRSPEGRQGWHVRSPVRIVPDGESRGEEGGNPKSVFHKGERWCLREDGEDLDPTRMSMEPVSFLPVHAHLTGRGGERTWSSELFAKFFEGCPSSEKLAGQKVGGRVLVGLESAGGWNSASEVQVQLEGSRISSLQIQFLSKIRRFEFVPIFFKKCCVFLVLGSDDRKVVALGALVKRSDDGN